MNRRFEDMERCIHLGRQQDDGSLLELTALLKNDDWRIRFAAAVALGDRADPRSIEPLLDLLRAEDAAPLYSQSGDLSSAPAGAPNAGQLTFPEGTTAATRAAWERRGRLKQSACIALGRIGSADERVLEFLHRYSTDAKEDYAVRAAAAKALGVLRNPLSRPFLVVAAQDEEWCTKTEARKALTAL